MINERLARAQSGQAQNASPGKGLRPCHIDLLFRRSPSPSESRRVRLSSSRCRARCAGGRAQQLSHPDPATASNASHESESAGPSHWYTGRAPGGRRGQRQLLTRTTGRQTRDPHAASRHGLETRAGALPSCGGRAACCPRAAADRRLGCSLKALVRDSGLFRQGTQQAPIMLPRGPTAVSVPAAPG